MTKFARFLVAAALATATAACGDDNGTNNNGGDDDNSMSATVDGATFTANLAVQGTYTDNTLAVGGTSSNTRGINFVIPNITQTGTFDVGPGFGAILTYNIGLTAYVTSNVGGTGTITVTKLTNDEAEGTFAVTAIGAGGAVGTKTITNGKFKVEF